MNDVQLLLGTNSQEGVLFIYPLYAEGMSQQAYSLWLQDVLSSKDQTYSQPALDQIHAAYPSHAGDNRSILHLCSAALFFMSALSCFCCHVAALAAHVARMPSPPTACLLNGLPDTPRAHAHTRAQTRTRTPHA
jgi:carboxylesterase type B